MTTPRRFSTAAAHYLAGRPEYAPRLIRRVAGLCGLRPSHRVMDLGCGPGPLAVALAPFAARIVAIDPEPEMLRAARARPVPANIEWVRAAAEDLGPAFGRFHLVAIGRAFHWMDRADTLRRLDPMIEPGGAIALFQDEHLAVPDNAWREPWREIVNRYAADDPGRARTRSPDWVRHEAVLLDSAFCELEDIAVIERRRVSTETLIDRALSLSSTSHARIGTKADLMVAELRDRLTAIAPGGILSEVIATSALIARRPGSAT
jgi:trans-aconitate methyltransferase